MAAKAWQKTKITFRQKKNNPIVKAGTKSIKCPACSGKGKIVMGK